MEIVSDKKNELLGRRELVLSIENSKATHKREELKSVIAKKLKVEEDLIIISNVRNYFGDSNMQVKAKIYDSKEILEKYAREHMIKRNTKVEEKEEAAE